jgi:outer membrane receptor protein involved in Fe transport
MPHPPPERSISLFRCLLLAVLQAVGATAVSAETLAPARADATSIVEEVVVRAVRRATPLDALDRSGAVRDVDAPAAIESVTDLLRHAPGTFFQQTTPGQSTPILRGLRGSQVLHLVDGIRLNNAIFRDAPNQYLALVPVEGLEAVEVLPGAAPALYGADALGGVVVLRSRTPRFSEQGLEAGARAQAGWSSADLRRTFGVGSELRGERAAAAFGYADRSFGNRRMVDGGRVSGTGYDARSAYFNSRFALGSEHHLELAGQWAEQPSTPRVDELVPGFGQDAPASERFLFRPNSRAMVRVGWRWRSATRPERALRVDLARQRVVDDRLTRATGATVTTLENNRSTLHGLVLQYDDVSPGLGRFVSGVELYDDRVDSARSELSDAGRLAPRPARFGDGARLRSAALFVVPEWRPSWPGEDALAITLGLRASAYRIEVPGRAGAGAVDLDASELTGRLGVRWRASPNWTFYGSYGRGFRPPNAFDLGALGPRPGNRFNVGNGDLGPERLDNVELGARLRFPRGSAELALFAADHDDRIRSELTGAVTATGRDVVRSINGGTSRYRGAELQLRWWPTSTTELDAVVNAVRGEDDFAAAVTPGDRIPPVNARLRLRQNLSHGLAATLALSGAGRQDRLSARDLRDPRIDPSGTDSWLRLDAGLVWAFRHGAEGRLEIGNVGNTRYREHGSGLDAPGRYLAVGLDWTL